MSVISGTAYWASLTIPNTKFEPVYQLDLAVDIESDEWKRLVKEHPVLEDKLKEHEEYGHFIKIKTNAEKKDGTPNRRPKLVDAAKNPIDVLVGNGSKVKVSFNEYDWTWKGKAGTNFGLRGVQVLELVSYDPTGDEFEEEAGGYTSDDVIEGDDFDLADGEAPPVDDEV